MPTTINSPVNKSTILVCSEKLRMRRVFKKLRRSIRTGKPMPPSTMRIINVPLTKRSPWWDTKLSLYSAKPALQKAEIAWNTAW